MGMSVPVGWGGCLHESIVTESLLQIICLPCNKERAALPVNGFIFSLQDLAVSLTKPPVLGEIHVCLVTEDEGTLVLGTQFLTLNTASPSPLAHLSPCALSYLPRDHSR